MNKVVSVRNLNILLKLCGTAILWLHVATAGAQEYPPTGERLRVLADNADFQIGYASRYNFRVQTYAELYEQIVKAEFNIVTPENSVKWENVHPLQTSYDFDDMDTLVQFAEENNMVLHGHPLLWYNQNPDWIISLPEEQVEAAMLDHIDTVVSRYAGKIKVWDVVNEALEDTSLGGGYRDNIWLQAMGESYVEKAFVRARAADPTASLIYNDYDVGWFTPKGEAMYNLVTDLVDAGVPLDGVGFQMHIGATFEEYEEFSSNMQRYADMGLDIYITEFDVKTLRPSEYPLQGVVYEEVIRRCLAQPRCKALQIWGIDDFNSWQPFFDPLPFDDDFNIKPAYYGMQRALLAKALHVENHSSPENIIVESGVVKPLASGGSLKLDQVNFEPGYQSLTLRYANSSRQTASVDIRLDSLDGPLLASVATPATASATLFSSVDSVIATTDGVHDVYVIFNTPVEGFSLDYVLLNTENRTPSETPIVDEDSPATSSSGMIGPITVGWLATMLWYRRRFLRLGSGQWSFRIIPGYQKFPV